MREICADMNAPMRWQAQAIECLQEVSLELDKLFLPFTNACDDCGSYVLIFAYAVTSTDFQSRIFSVKSDHSIKINYL